MSDTRVLSEALDKTADTPTYLFDRSAGDLMRQAAAAIRELHAENARLISRIASADALHHPERFTDWASGEPDLEHGHYCRHDIQDWPCSTYRALHSKEGTASNAP